MNQNTCSHGVLYTGLVIQQAFDNVKAAAGVKSVPLTQKVWRIFKFGFWQPIERLKIYKIIYKISPLKKYLGVKIPKNLSFHFHFSHLLVYSWSLKRKLLVFMIPSNSLKQGGEFDIRMNFEKVLLKCENGDWKFRNIDIIKLRYKYVLYFLGFSYHRYYLRVMYINLKQ